MRNIKGWLPDRPDFRDYRYSTIRPKAKALPKSVNLKNKMSPVEDQGQLGSCTANAAAGALEFLEIKAKLPLVDLSRLFVYYNTRVIEGTVSSDSGAMLRDVIKTLAKDGVCPESQWPYLISRFTKKPSSDCYVDGKKHTISSYHRIDGLAEMKACLAEGYPFVFGFAVYESFESDHVAKTGTVPMPKSSEAFLGGHAVCATGYDDRTKRFKVRNSWGPDWGADGYFTMPYDYIGNPDLAADFWTIRS